MLQNIQPSIRETMVDIQESVRGKDVYIIQTASRNVNDVIMELLIMAYACKTSNCKNIVGILPCLPYSQQTKVKLIALKVSFNLRSSILFDCLDEEKREHLTEAGGGYVRQGRLRPPADCGSAL